MDPKLHEISEVFDDQRMEPVELLEENWFFGNLLDGSKSRMFRSYSDPCTTSSFSEKSYDDVYESIQKLPGDTKLTRFNLVKAPSMPSSMENRSCKNSESKGKSHRQSSSASVLSRAPSLPVSLATDEIQDEEIEFSMGKLIRQASMSTPDVLPPRIHSSKNLTPSPSLSRHQSRMKPVLDSIKSAGLDGIRMNQLKEQKSSIIVESKQLQRAKDMPIDSNPHALSPNPCLQEKKRIDESKEKYITSRQYLPDTWRANSSPPVPKWSSKKSAEDIMKEQIKFWARAVASNVN